MSMLMPLVFAALGTVSVTRGPMEIPTYEVGRPDRNPMFFEKRVYQGSCGKIYPIPFIDKVYDERKTNRYDAVTLENEFVRIVVLPELGGRIYIGQDKTNANYDFFYRNDVIKPALVGLAGPWLSGGVEFNWPQHHRPATFMPTDVEIERETDGGVVVWMSDHDPIFRLYARHGIGLKPGSSVVRLRAKVYNRTPMTQTFHWWANVAVRVHERYESFFPPDVDYVADHAVRAISSFPLARNSYYGVDYAARPGANDLRWYRNIPVPTSYMVCDTRYDFFGGYDHATEGGFVHVADRHIAPGKKQWTWGNAPFGYAWDRELTDESGPYIELMAGVYTDNQPDFTYLLPFETKTFTQCWWPYAKIGPVLNANERAALNFRGAVVSEPIENARIELMKEGRVIASVTNSLAVGCPCELPAAAANADEVVLRDDGERIILSCHRESKPATSVKDRRPAAEEPPQPKDVLSADELFLIAEHLDQYRHPTRAPESYLDEILRRDPLDCRAHILYSKRLLARGLFKESEDHARKAVRRLTHRHPNPYTGEAHYYLGLSRWYQGNVDGAYEGFAKAAWNHEFAASAQRMMDTIRSARGESVEFAEPPRIAETWDPERRLDYAYEDVARGRFASAEALLARNGDHAMSRCVRACLACRAGQAVGRVASELKTLCPDYFFPNRLEDYVVLRELDARLDGKNAAIRYALGNFLYDRRRHEEALEMWRSVTELDPAFPTAWRNLGVALWNVRHDGTGAMAAYRKAMAADSTDARLVAEYDQLCEKCHLPSAERFAFLDSKRTLVFTRDDATVAYVTLLNDLGRCEEALAILRRHRFHPWEGGEGKVLLQWARASATLAARATDDRAAAFAREAFDPPQNLGETFHLVLDDPELKCYKAMALKAQGRADAARELFSEALTQAKKGLSGEIKIDYFATSLPLLLIFDDDYAAVMRTHYERIVRLAEEGLDKSQKEEGLDKSQK